MSVVVLITGLVAVEPVFSTFVPVAGVDKLGAIEATVEVLIGVVTSLFIVIVVADGTGVTDPIVKVVVCAVILHNWLTAFAV